MDVPQSIADARFDRLITVRDAYRAMERFVEAHVARGVVDSDVLLAHLGVLTDGGSADPAALGDFLDAVDAAAPEPDGAKGGASPPAS